MVRHSERIPRSNGQLSATFRGDMIEPPLDLAKIRENSWIRTFVYEKQVTSTNTLAMQMASSSHLEMPLLFLADEQVSGRGRGTNSWWSTAGSVTMSLAVSRVGLTMTPQAVYSLGAALAVLATLKPYAAAERLALKWPNDVMCDGKKLAGILLETAHGLNDALIIGIGINVNNQLASAPENIRNIGTSLSDATGNPVNRSELVCGLVSNLEELCARRSSVDQLIEDYRRVDFLWGKQVRVHRAGESLCGVCRGIDGSGALLLATSDELISLASGTVEVESDERAT